MQFVIDRQRKTRVVWRAGSPLRRATTLAFRKWAMAGYLCDMLAREHGMGPARTVVTATTAIFRAERMRNA